MQIPICIQESNQERTSCYIQEVWDRRRLLPGERCTEGWGKRGTEQEEEQHNVRIITAFFFTLWVHDKHVVFFHRLGLQWTSSPAKSSNTSRSSCKEHNIGKQLSEALILWMVQITAVI